MRKPVILDRIEKDLVVCPACYAQGTLEFLGEIDNGEFVIERRHRVSRNRLVRRLTRIVGDHFTVYCGQCGEPVYQKGGTNEGTNHGFFGISRYQFTGTIIPGTA